MVSWSCVVYNPQSTKKHGRMRDIARNFRWNDFIALPGTHTRQQDSSKPCIMQSVGKHRLYCWGSGKGAHVNESCGVTLGIKHRSFPERSVVRIFSPPPELQGRGGAVRIERGDADITPIVVYVPTEPNSRKDQAASKAIWQWVHDLLSSLPSRTVPVLMLDANGKTGLRHNAVGNFHEYFDDSGLDAAMPLWRRTMIGSSDHHMCAVNTFYDVGPTWYGWTFEGLSSRIDYICLPQSLRVHVKSCRILQQCGDALQNMVRQEGAITGHCKWFSGTNFVSIIMRIPRHGIETCWYNVLQGADTEKSLLDKWRVVVLTQGIVGIVASFIQTSCGNSCKILCMTLPNPFSKSLEKKVMPSS